MRPEHGNPHGQGPAQVVNLHPERCTPGELLQTADRIMRMAQPAFQAGFYLHGWRYRAKWEYPGVLSVWSAVTGAMLVRSRPGYPAKPAAAKRGTR